LAPARDLIGYLKKVKDEIKRPHLDANAAAEKAFKDLTDPLTDLATEKHKQKLQVIERVKQEQAKIEAEKQRIKAIKDFMSEFFEANARIISNPKVTVPELVAAEKKIGAQLSRKHFFDELLPEFQEKTTVLRQMIANAKEILAKEEKLAQKIEAETQKGNTEAVEELLLQKEDVGLDLMQTRTEAMAYGTNVKVEAEMTHIPSLAGPTVSPSRRQWTFEITDIKELYKKYPALVELTPNVPAIRAMGAEQRKENVGKTEIILPGIRFYQEEKYK